MSSRTGNWMIAMGAVVMLAGLCFLPAAMGEHADSSLLSSGAVLFALGALVIAGGVYIKALALKATAGQNPAKDTGNAKRVRGGCELCGTEAPVIQCKVHQLHMCGSCLAEHYDFRSCVYAPTTRGAGNKSPKVAAKARGAS